MEKEIRILIVEDVPADAEAVEAALRKDGLNFRLQRMETPVDFFKELQSSPPDVILSDHGFPSFSGFDALAIAQSQCPDVPFIFVTNALSPEMEIEKLAPGVTDLIAKRDLSKLGPAIRNALSKSKPHRELSHDELGQLVMRLRAFLAAYDATGFNVPVCSACKRIRDKDGGWVTMEDYFSKNLKLKFSHGICPDCTGFYFKEQ